MTNLLPLANPEPSDFFGRPVIATANPRDPSPAWQLGFIVSTAPAFLPDGAAVEDVITFSAVPGAADGAMTVRRLTCAVYPNLATAQAAAGTASSHLPAVAAHIFDPALTP